MSAAEEAGGEALSPGVVHDLIESMDALAGRPPAAASQAATELDRQAELFAGRSGWEAPIGDAHQLGGAALAAASDALRAYLCLLGEEPAPLFAHLVVARAAVDASVVAAWLNQPGDTVSVEERARRGLVELYHDALQRRRVPELRPAADRQQDEFKRVATALRWTLITGPSDEDLSIGGTRRPAAVPGARALLAGDLAGPVGSTLWDHVSAVMPGSWHPQAPARADVQLLGLVRMYLKAAGARAELMGWASPAWEEARARAEGAVGDLLTRLPVASTGKGR